MITNNIYKVIYNYTGDPTMLMASSSSTFLLRRSSTYTYTSYVMFLLLLLLLVFSEASRAEHATGCYTSIFSFGDSLTDTGNLLHISNVSVQPPPHFALPPYGETYFHRPTGRCSDGRLVIDFIAQHLGLPLVPPYFNGQNESELNLREGVNFAVVGATALDIDFFRQRGISNPFTNISLGDQLRWFKDLFSSHHLCRTSSSASVSDCKELLRTSLILMGEIGGNDYNQAFEAGRSINEIQSFVPPVVSTIASAINELIELGAVTIMVPGNLPIGCAAYYLNKFMSSSKEDYDPESGCLTWLNEFAEFHNEMLLKELNRIQAIHPYANVIYADFYNAAMVFYRSPLIYGFSSREALSACCGGEGPYNVNASVRCGYRPSSVCDDPSLHFSWDGIHLTEAAYRWISKGLLEGSYTIPRINASCVSLSGSYTVSF